MLWNRRLLANWAEGIVVELLKCITDPNDCNWETYVDMTSGKVGATMDQALCNTYESTVKLVSLLISAVSPALSLSYAASGHPTVQVSTRYLFLKPCECAHDEISAVPQGGATATDPHYIMSSHAVCSSYGPLNTGDGPGCAGLPDNVACATKDKKCVDSCPTMVSESDCTSSKECMWLHEGVAHARCVRGMAPWVLHQSYPLEASLITLVTSFLNMVYFWPQYMTNVVYNSVMNALQLQAANNVCPSCGSSPGPSASSPVIKDTLAPFNISAGDNIATDGASINYSPLLGTTPSYSTTADWKTISDSIKAPPKPPTSASAQAKLDIRNIVMGVPHVLILNFIRDAVLPPRDITVAFYEVVRASVYVADPSDLANPDFVKFSVAIRDTLDIIELVSAVVCEAMVDMSQTIIRIYSDMLRILVDTKHAQKYALDILKSLLRLLEDFEQLILRIVINMPGIKEICTSMIQPIAKFINKIIHFVCDVIHSIHDMINSVSGTIASVINTIAGFITDTINGIVAGINAIDDAFGGNGDVVDKLTLPDIGKLIMGAVNSAFKTIEGDVCRAGISEDFCNLIGGGNGTMDFEPTPCVTDDECSPSRKPTPMCWVDSATTSCQWSNFNNHPDIKNQHSEWAQPCNCNDFKDMEAHAPFCNVATGYCQEGPSFIAPPLELCPVGGSLDIISTFRSSDAYKHATCFLMPTWKCSAQARRMYNLGWLNGSTLAGSGNGDLDILRALNDCRLSLANDPGFAQGPFLCSDFCSPNVIHADNRLTQACTITITTYDHILLP